MTHFAAHTVVLVLALAAIACGPGRSRTPGAPGTDGSTSTGPDGGTTAPDGATIRPDGGATAPDGGGGIVRDAGPMMATGEPGSACSCDGQCTGSGANPGVCVQGICMTRSSGDCAEAGSAAECPTGSRCWGLEGVEGGVCWPDCDAYACDGSCDGDGSCAFTESSTCDSTCSAICDDSRGGGGGGGGGDGCPPNSHLEGDSCYCDEGFTLSEDRTACEAECSSASDCSGGDICVDGRCETPPCTAGSCAAGLICASGVCVVDTGTAPPGPPPSACRAGSMGIPNWRCTSGCTDLVPFSPATGPGYDNYPINGETATNQYRSYVRRDVMMLVKYATAMVACQSAGWSFGNRGPLGLGDMSESDGAIPGTSIGSPGHPPGTHLDGADMDIGYYQTGTRDNRLRAICDHMRGGSDQYHCVSEPTSLEPWRTALFLGHLHANPNLRVIGVDGRAGVLIDSALTRLCSDDWVSGTACRSHRITYETTDMGRGWFHFHHHHLHISVSRP